MKQMQTATIGQVMIMNPVVFLIPKKKMQRLYCSCTQQLLEAYRGLVNITFGLVHIGKHMAVMKYVLFNDKNGIRKGPRLADNVAYIAAR